MKYKSVIVTRRGGPEVLQIVEKELREPAAREVRIKALAVPVCLPDVTNRYGRSPFRLRVPFVPGYAVIGTVDAVGEDVTMYAPGDRVAAFTAYGAYAEYIYWNAERLLPVPSTLDPAKAIPLILNYIVAYQTLHRSAKVKAGDKVLITGASGGIGTAFLQLGKLAGLKMYGVASGSKHSILIEYGAIPIDYHTEDFVEVIRQAEPQGLDAVFDGMGGNYFERSYWLLQRGGKLVGYANPLSLAGTLKVLGQTVLCNLLPDGRSATYYGTGISRFNWHTFLKDWRILFKLLEEGKIDPVIAARFPILEAAKANALLESRQVIGNIVLLAPELL
ncbi:MAG TPA: medium chain dehydrogenase/reductase family protein [Anaerolineales bacterium]|nr:medium chain dehydrogenase/reductase family protein [Anaerolineales bacterium]